MRGFGTWMAFVLAAAALLACGARASAAQALFGFEADPEIAAWKIRTAQQDRLERSPRFATAGQTSMRFTTPAWKEGMEQWPAFEAKPPVSDWRPYDRLVVDVVNPCEERFFFSLFISDSKVPFREALSYTLQLPSRGFKRYLVPLSFPAKVDRADIAILHFFTQRPKGDMELFIDNLTLLKRGEAPPEPRPGFAAEVAALFVGGIASFDGVLAECRDSLRKLADTPALLRRADREVDAMAARVRKIREEAASPDLTLARLDTLREEVGRLPGEAARLASALKLQRDFDRLGMGDSPMLVGFATSMEKVLPRDVPFDLTVSKGVAVSLARNEKESFQVAVLPRGDGLKGVSVSVGDLKSRSGAVLKAEQVECDVVGYVETKARPPYNVSYVGWWPDPILDFLGPVDVAKGDLQSFWVRVRAPKGQAPGVYRGTLQVSAAGAKPLQFALTVRVYDFTLPDCTPLPTAITFFEPRKLVGEERWPEIKHRYADFLADYLIDYDSLYRQGPPDFEIVKRLHDEGRLVAFNLGNVFNAGTSEEGFEKAIADTVARLRPAYEKAKALGLLDHAYIYGFDERPKEQFGLLERSAQALRKAFPEVLLMTTSYDDSFGLESEVKTIDAWCPLTPKFDVARAAKARSGGKKVWWYICCGPHNPFANWFVEYAAIESRLLMGAMTAKCRPDGFLYYSLDIWNDNKPIETGPFTAWNPVSWTTYHGDGSLFCCGPGGKPVPTIRLENYRDGQEDYAYACILEEAIRRVEAKQSPGEKQRQWLAEARAALPVPEALVKTLSEYSHDPRVLYAWRDRVGNLIDRSGVPDADPWGKEFGVRGFGPR